jgi:murein DD-endopeptidase MepM/ murein hydrolase activator NlpD
MSRLVFPKPIFKRAACLAFAILLPVIYSLNPVSVSALSEEQKRIFNKNIYYFDLASCSDTGNADATTVEPGKGKPSGAAFPNLDPKAMSKALDKYIAQTNPKSKLKGLGTTIVESSNNSNVSPFLIVAIAQKESSLSSPDDFNVKKGNNSFGRTATSSQPNFQGSRLWYKWSTVKASVDYKASENKDAAGGGDIAAYLREQFGQLIDEGQLTDLMMKYAPPGDNNDTQKYIQDIKEWTSKMVDLTNQESGDNDPQAANASEQQQFTGPACCPLAQTDQLAGSGNVEKAFNFFAGEKKLSPAVAAGIVGSMMSESGEKLDTNAVNPSSRAYGIAQWLGGRLTKLHALAQSKGVEPNNLGFQLDYIWFELTGTEGATLAAIKDKTSAPEVAELWENKFERSGGALIPQRKAYAQQVFDKYGSSSTGGAATAIEGSCVDDDPTGTGTTKGDYAIPVPEKYWKSNPDWFSKPHHDYPAADIPVPSGTKIYSVTSGKVKSVGMSGGAGYAVFVDYQGVEFGYFHGTPGTAKVKAGETVTAGQQLMLSDNTGHSFGAHLHLNIRVGGQNRCPQALFKAMRSNQSYPDLSKLPSSGCFY